MYSIKDQGDIADFLGVRIKPITMDVEETDLTTGETRTITKNGYKMTRTGLIDQILKDVGLVDDDNLSKTGTKSKPMKKPPLPRLPGEPAFDEGKLNFLAMNTRPDISYATHA